MGILKSIGRAISGAVKAVVNVVKSVVKAVVGVVKAVVNFVTQPFMGLLGGAPNMPNASAEAQRQDGVLLQAQGSNVNIPIVYGLRKVGGTVVNVTTGSTNNQFLWVAYTFSEGPVSGIYKMFIDDYELALSETELANLNAGQVVEIKAGKYIDRVKMQFSPGVYFTDPTTSSLNTAVRNGAFAGAPDSFWNNNMHFNGVATLFMRFYWVRIEGENAQAIADANPFTGSIPNVQLEIFGRRVDRLINVDASGTLGYYYPENSNYGESSSIAHTYNPVEILLDYLRNPRYGKGLTNADIDWDSFRVAANKCNKIVEYTNYQGTVLRGPIMTSNVVVDTGQTLFSNVKMLLQGMRGYMPYIQGKYKLKIEDAGHPTDINSSVATVAMTFEPDDIQGDVQFTRVDKAARFSVVAVNYVEPEQKYSVQQVIYPESEALRQTYITEDGGRENKMEATFPTCTNYAQAKNFARMLLEKSRRQDTCSLTVSSKALELEPGDIVRIQSNILDFGTDAWRVVSLQVNDNMTVQLSCVRNPATIYPFITVDEEDDVVPPFIPKEEGIQYPSSRNPVPVGLIQPLRPKQSTTRPYPDINPAEFILPGPDFIYPSPGGPDNPYDGNRGENDTPPLPEPSKGFDVNILSTGIKIEYRANLSGTVDGYFTFGSQPADGGYDYVTIQIVNTGLPPPPKAPDSEFDIRNPLSMAGFFGDTVDLSTTTLANAQSLGVTRTLSSIGQFRSFREKPGVGIPFTVYFENINARPGDRLEVTFICFSIDGRASTRIPKIQSTVSIDGPQPIEEDDILEDGGWDPQPDPSPIPEPPKEILPQPPVEQPKIHRLKSISATPVLSAGAPQDPLVFDFTFTEDLSVVDPDYRVSGVSIYYRLKGSTGSWFLSSAPFSSAYVPGKPETVRVTTLINNFYPSVPTTAQQSWDWVFRIFYSNSPVDQSQNEMATATSALVEVRNGNYSFDIFDPAFVTINPGKAANNPLTIFGIQDAQATDAEMTIGVKDVQYEQVSSNGQRIRDASGEYAAGTNYKIRLYPPNVVHQAQWVGVKVLYRPTRISLETELTYREAAFDVNGFYNITIRNVNPEFDYDIILIPVYRGASKYEEGSNALYGKIQKVLAVRNSNIVLNTIARIKTDEARLKYFTVGTADPQVALIGWDIATTPYYQPKYNWAVREGGVNVTGLTQAPQVFKLTYDVRHLPSTGAGKFMNVRVYRRIKYTNLGITDITEPNHPVTAAYMNVGQWERVDLSTYSSSANIEVLLRPPLIPNFNRYYQTSQTGQDTANLKLPYQIKGSNDARYISNGRNELGRIYEWFITVTTSPSGSGGDETESPVGIYLNGFAPNGSSVNGWFPEGSKYGVVVNRTLFDSAYTNGYLRRLTEADTVVYDYSPSIYNRYLVPEGQTSDWVNIPPPYAGAQLRRLSRLWSQSDTVQGEFTEISATTVK